MPDVITSQRFSAGAMLLFSSLQFSLSFAKCNCSIEGHQRHQCSSRLSNTQDASVKEGMYWKKSQWSSLIIAEDQIENEQRTASLVSFFWFLQTFEAFQYWPRQGLWAWPSEKVCLSILSFSLKKSWELVCLSGLRGSLLQTLPRRLSQNPVVRQVQVPIFAVKVFSGRQLCTSRCPQFQGWNAYCTNKRQCYCPTWAYLLRERSLCTLCHGLNWHSVIWREMPLNYIATEQSPDHMYSSWVVLLLHDQLRSDFILI